jgi:predicted permease
VSAAQITPVGRTAWNEDIHVEGFVPSSERDNMALVNEVTSAYFETLGTRMLAGRDFDERDNVGTPKVAVVNEEFALRFFGTRNIIGREFRLRDEASRPYQVVGLVETGKYQSLREEPQPAVYLAWSQAEERTWSMTFALRGPAGVATLSEGVKQAAADVDPTMSLRFNTLARQMSDSLARERVLALLSALFGGLALLLAMVGLYGVMSYNVARRGSEIGIRMALGCARARVVRMVLGEAAGLVAAGLMVGTLLALAGTRFVASFLYGMSPTDGLTFALSATVLALVGLGASALPAWRAARVEPMSALREE